VTSARQDQDLHPIARHHRVVSGPRSAKARGGSYRRTMMKVPAAHVQSKEGHAKAMVRKVTPRRAGWLLGAEKKRT
jgi:hypothetical protein